MLRESRVSADALANANASVLAPGRAVAATARFISRTTCRVTSFPHMLRRYCPPTSNSALVICPSEHTRTASISTSNTLRLSITAC